MQFCTLFVFIFCFYMCYAVAFAQKQSKNNIQDNDKWIWGYVEETTVENRNKDKDDVKANITEYDPCKFYNPKKPSFKAPGRRVSEEACEEYLWDIKLNEERSRRNKECFDIMYANKPPPPATVGGRPTYSGEFPHMGALGWKAVGDGYIFKCGSTLISPKFVLTAAHCSRAPVDDTIIDSSPKIVRLNDKNIFHTESEGVSDYNYSTDMNITRVINHPNYKSPKKYYDIALVELVQAVDYTNYMRPACLWTNGVHSELGRDATLTGWGVLKFGSHEISPELQAADVNIIDPEQCDRLLFSSRNRHWQGLMENQLCAGKLSGGVDACQGDSGGPLQIIKYKKDNRVLYNIIGVTSFGIGCALPNLPGIYTRVSSFIDWIEPIVWSDSNK